MFHKTRIILVVSMFLVLSIEIDCSRNVAEICGRGEGGDSPTSPDEKKKEQKAEQDNEDDATNNKYFYQGDMRVTKDQKEKLKKKKKDKSGKRDVISFASYKWSQPQNIKYEVADDLNDAAKSAIDGAIADFHSYTCLRFIKRTDKSKYFIRFIKDNGCWSYVGRLPDMYLTAGYKQEISIGIDCEYKGTVIHEMLHALGFFHEHSRLDRDQFIAIKYQNIIPEYVDQFEINADQTNLGVSYDYNSVMHYDLHAFSSNNQPTLETKGDAQGAEIGHRDGMSDKDIEQVRLHYGCLAPAKRSGYWGNGTTSGDKRDKKEKKEKKNKDVEGGKCDVFAKSKNKE